MKGMSLGAALALLGMKGIPRTRIVKGSSKPKQSAIDKNEMLHKAELKRIKRRKRNLRNEG